jgi:hypothetical protein
LRSSSIPIRNHRFFAAGTRHHIPQGCDEKCETLFETGNLLTRKCSCSSSPEIFVTSLQPVEMPLMNGLQFRDRHDLVDHVNHVTLRLTVMPYRAGATAEGEHGGRFSGHGHERERAVHA